MTVEILVSDILLIIFGCALITGSAGMLIALIKSISGKVNWTQIVASLPFILVGGFGILWIKGATIICDIC